MSSSIPIGIDSDTSAHPADHSKITEPCSLPASQRVQHGTRRYKGTPFSGMTFTKDPATAIAPRGVGPQAHR